MKIKNELTALRTTQYIRYGLTPLPFGTLLPLVGTSYMLRTLDDIALWREDANR
jgi:hypothetical protein